MGLVLCAGALAKDAGADSAKDAAKWDVMAPHGNAKSVKFTTNEGTWLDVDVSPDGKQLAFSMLGDIYLLPITGGSAKRILSGKAFEVQPRFSPDGKRLSFTSDRLGGDNIWTSDLEGGALRQITKESFRLLNNADWTPDGDYLIARKHFTSERSLGAGEMWLHHVGGGDGLKLTTRKNDQQDAGQPQSSADGRYLYFSEDVSAGGFFQYNKNPHETIYALRQLDRKTGELSELLRMPGGAVSPTPSPDGKLLAYVRRVQDKSVLHVMDLASRASYPLWDGMSRDQQEAWAIFGPYPNMAFTPDSKAIVAWAQGKLWRVALDGGAQPAQEIPFTAEVEQLLDEPVRATHRVEREARFKPHMIRDVSTSADGKQMIFHAAGRLYLKRLPNGKAERLTRDESAFEYSPAFAPDGKSVVYVRWHDEELGSLERVELASGKRVRLSKQAANYARPQFSSNGKYLTYTINAGGGLVDFRYAQHAGVYLMELKDLSTRKIAAAGEAPSFNADASAVFYLSGGGLSKKLMRVGLHGEEAREVFNLKYVDAVVPSPDGRFVAFTELFNAYVAPMPQTGGSIELSKDSTTIPVAKVSEDVGSYLHWSGDTLHWMVGRRYHSRRLEQSLPYLAGSESKPGAEQEADAGLDIGLELALDKPSDDELVAFTNARIITMRGSEVLENASLLVRGNSIIAVGTDVEIPKQARVIDASGKTIMPGIVDVHAHAAHFHSGPSPQANWAYYANLAFGITTMHDPSANTQEVFSQAELVKAGLNVGPRVYSTGTILYGADGDFKAVINSLDDARAHLRRLKAQGAFSVKSYNQPRRDQRQQINQAARELGMIVVMEGGSTFNHNLTMILDGSTGIEHNLPVAPLYKDVLETWKATDVRNTPTLVVSFGGLSGEYWFYQHDNVWENQRLKRFVPRELIDARSIRREMAPEWDFHHINVSKSLKAAHDAGVAVQVGGHGQMQGLAPHWEIWMLAQGGMSQFEALRAATFAGADYLGLSQDLGSLEVGKLADLIVLNSNPLENIRATADGAYVMVNGRLFAAETMIEVGGKQRPAPRFYWQRDGLARSIMGGLSTPASCHCPKGAHP
jgi:imidazolonepropionase-like amidohydrolase/Tol biopolymer transport system component